MFPSPLNQFVCDVPFSPKAVPAPGFSAALSFPLVRSCHGDTSPGTVSLWDGHSVVEVVFCSVLTKHMKSSHFTPCSLDCLQIIYNWLRFPATKKNLSLYAKKQPIFQPNFIYFSDCSQKVYKWAQKKTEPQKQFRPIQVLFSISVHQIVKNDFDMLPIWQTGK